MVLTLVAQAQSKLEGVLSGIGCAGVGESLEWELPSDEEEQEQSSELRSTEEWKQYVATYGQSYTERYFASYYHSQVNICPHSSFGWPRCVICIFYMLGQNVCAVCCISLSFKMLPVYGAAATFDYLKQNGLPTDHLQ